MSDARYFYTVAANNWFTLGEGCRPHVLVAPPTRGAADVASLRGRSRPALPAGRGRSRHVLQKGPAGACEERSSSDRDDTNPLINKRRCRCGCTRDCCDDLPGSNALGYRAPNDTVDGRERCV